MDFRILEARHFVSPCGSFVSRISKDYEIDMECTSGRIYSYDTIRERRLSLGDILVRKPRGFTESTGMQNSYILTLDFSGAPHSGIYSRNIPGKFQDTFEHEAITRLEPIIHPSHVTDIMRIYRKLISLPNPNSDIARELVQELIYMLNAEISKKNYELLKPTETIVETMISYMREHLDRRITLDDLSDMAHLEKCYLLRLFRKETGKTPIETLIEMRLDKASDLVTATNLNIYEVAAECGYITVSFFIAAYKKRYGMTPEVHRRTIRENTVEVCKETLPVL